MLNDLPLSNFDLDNLMKDINEIKNANIIEAKKIKPNTDIWKNSGHCILYCENEGEDIGHWIVITRPNKEINYFWDSYGDTPRHFSPFLQSCLDYNGCKTLFINREKFQNYNSNCCGKYCLFFIAMNKMNFNMQETQSVLKSMKKKYGSYDNFINQIFKNEKY